MSPNLINILVYNLIMNNYFDKSSKLGNEIYVYKSFLNKEELNKYNDYIESMEEDKWEDSTKFLRPGIFGAADPIVWEILKKIQTEIVPEGLFLEGTPTIMKMKNGVGMSEHTDSCHHCINIENPDFELKGRQSKICVKYGVVLYLSKFTGGEIYYPDQDIVFTPEPGDLILHSTDKNCKHGVKQVIDGVRYSIAPYIVKYINEIDAIDAESFWKDLV